MFRGKKVQKVHPNFATNIAIKSQNLRTTPTKSMMNIASTILGVVYMMLFSWVLTIRRPSLQIPLLDQTSFVVVWVCPLNSWHISCQTLLQPTSFCRSAGRISVFHPAAKGGCKVGKQKVQGQNSLWVPLSLLFVCQRELTEFFAELTEFAVKLSEAQWVLFSEPVLTKQYIPPVS